MTTAPGADFSSLFSNAATNHAEPRKVPTVDAARTLSQPDGEHHLTFIETAPPAHDD